VVKSESKGRNERGARRSATTAAAALLVVLSGGQAAAVESGYVKRPRATREFEASVSPMVGVSGRYGPEGGAKVDYLMADAAFVPTLNDAVFLEGAVFVAKERLFVAPALRWDFNLHPQWTVYGEAGIEANVRTSGDDDDKGGAEIVAAAGVLWRIPEKGFFLRGEVDLGHGAVRVGPMWEL
jgi:hypothetical protein